MLVMSNIPTQVRAVIDVDLPRPRRLSDLVESNRANDIKKQALSILHAEAMRSFSRGSKAAADFVEAYLKRPSRGCCSFPCPSRPSPPSPPCPPCFLRRPPSP